MFYGAKENDVRISTGNVHYITFGRGDRPLVMIPGLRLANINGGSKPVAWFYRQFAKEYKVYIVNRRILTEGYMSFLKRNRGQTPLTNCKR